MLVMFVFLNPINQNYYFIIRLGSQVINCGNILKRIRQKAIMAINGMTPFIISFKVTPSSGGTTPWQTKTDIAMGGV